MEQAEFVMESGRGWWCVGKLIFLSDKKKYTFTSNQHDTSMLSPPDDAIVLENDQFNRTHSGECSVRP
jgi:hypothetical protein